MSISAQSLYANSHFLSPTESGGHLLLLNIERCSRYLDGGSTETEFLHETDGILFVFVAEIPRIRGLLIEGFHEIIHMNPAPDSFNEFLFRCFGHLLSSTILVYLVAVMLTEAGGDRRTITQVMTVHSSSTRKRMATPTIHGKMELRI